MKKLNVMLFSILIVILLLGSNSDAKLLQFEIEEPTIESLIERLENLEDQLSEYDNNEVLELYKISSDELKNMNDSFISLVGYVITLVGIVLTIFTAIGIGLIPYLTKKQNDKRIDEIRNETSNIVIDLNNLIEEQNSRNVQLISDISTKYDESVILNIELEENMKENNKQILEYSDKINIISDKAEKDIKRLEYLLLMSEAQSYINDDKLHEAIGKLQKALVFNIDDRNVLSKLGSCYLDLKELDGAEKYLLECIKRYPKDNYILFKLGILYYDKKNFGDAILKFEESLDGTSLSGTSYGMIGLCYEKLNEDELALKAYMKSYECNPNDTESLLCLIEISSRMQHKEKTLLYIEEYADKNIDYDYRLEQAVLNFLKNEERYKLAIKKIKTSKSINNRKKV